MGHTTPAVAPRAGLLGPGLTLGFGSALAMWTLGYAARLPSVSLPAAATAGMLLAVLVSMGWMAGRAFPGVDSWKLGAIAGFINAAVNLLVLGSLLVRPDEAANSLRPNAGVMVMGWLVFGALCGGLSGAFGGRRAPSAPHAFSQDRWLARFAIVCAAGVLILLTLGGVVTSAQAGMAVPDWPNSYGANMFLYPLGRMTGGVYFEHAHRLFGALIGLTTLTLMLFTIVVERRAWVKWVAVGAFLFVCLQGALGGWRVIQNLQLLAFVHGVTGQLFFALMCSLAAFLSVRWKDGPGPTVSADAVAQRRFSWTLLITLIVQIALGALVRHFTKDGAPSMHALVTHVTVSVIVFAMAGVVGIRTMRCLPGDPLMPRLGKSLTHTVGLQMVLGGAALWAVLTYRHSDPTIELLLATGHQVVGAVLLGVATLTVAWSSRLLRARPPMHAC